MKDYIPIGGIGSDLFPIMGPHGGSSGGSCIPWKIIAPHEAQAQKNHQQSLARLAERGGLDPNEALCIILDKPWEPTPGDYQTRLVELWRVVWGLL